MKRGGMVLVFAFALVFLQSVVAGATEFSSSNFKIDGVIGESYSGLNSSTSYNLSAVGGESVIGNGSAGSYKIGEGYTSRLVNALQLTVQPGGLMAYYPFDTGTGTVAYDYSATNANLAFSGTPTWDTGKISGGITTSSGNVLTTSSTPSFSYSALTVCSWAKISSTGTTPTIAAQSDSGISTNNMWSIGFSTGATTPTASLRLGGTTYTATSATALGTGTWGHICATYDGNDLVLYQNGSEEDTVSINSAISAAGTALTVGSRGSGSVPLAGTVDQLKLFNRALTVKEIESEYSAQNTGVPSGLALGVTPGASDTADYDAVIQTDSPGYTLAINQNNNLTDGTYTIPAVSGSIASPVAWNEGTTTGLGFTLYGTNATSLPGTWGSGANYAALPGTATTMYTRTGYTGGSKDVLNMRLRLDVASSQVASQYTNQMTITGTMTP